MTAEQRLLLACLVAVVCWVCWQAIQRDFRCGYCGGLGSHDVNCPWNLDREERP